MIAPLIILEYIAISIMVWNAIILLVMVVNNEKMWGYFVRDLINPRKWGWVLEGRILSKYLQPHILEQVLIRQIECADCVENGKCFTCNCEMPEKTYILKAVCSHPDQKWGQVQDKEMWEETKKKFKIKIEINYGS